MNVENCIKWGYFEFTDKFAQRISEWTNTHQGEDIKLSNFDGYYNYIMHINNFIKLSRSRSTEYFIVHLPDSHPIKQEFPTILDMATTNINNLIKSLDLQFDSGLNEAISNGNEIWLNGKYIAVEYNK
jgi:hypothetical protein